MPENDPYKFQSSLPQAMTALNLTPQEQFLYNYHLKNLTGSGGVWRNGGAEISTIYQMPAEGPDGRFYNIPTVWDGKILSPKDAINRAGQVGWDKWPAYDSEEHAEVRYQRMHKYMDDDLHNYLKAMGGM